MKRETNKKSVWEELRIYLKPYKKEFIMIMLLMVLLGVLDASYPLLNKYAIDNFIEKRSIDGIGKFGFIYMIIVILASLTVYMFIRLAGKVETQMAYDIRKLGFKKLQDLSLSYYDEKAVGWLMSRLTSDINRLSETISWGLVDVTWGIAMMLAMFIAMLVLNARLTLLVVLMLPFLIALSILFQKSMIKIQRKIRAINSKITASYNEDIQGARTTKTLVREDKNLEEFSSKTRSMKDETIKAAKFSSIYLPLILLIGSIGTGLVVSIGGNQILRGAISYGTLIVFISYAGQFFEPINQMAVIFTEVQSAQASAERVFGLLNEEPAIKDSFKSQEKYKNIKDMPAINGDVEFRNVDFYYNEEEKLINQLSLKIKAGDTIALVGETGSGKSTLVNLICRFYEPVNGQILIDGIDYKEMPQAWIHENLGYVLQSPHLFNGTIRENIAYGAKEATDEEIIEASKLVNAHDFIMKLDKGYDSPVGEGGALLSIGQKQLISFARAIISRPSLFILDEATSSIDTETELIIQEAIDRVLEGRTSFIIAHRLSTIRNADRILVIKDGKIIEDGNHEELIREEGYYNDLYRNQFIGDLKI